MPTWQDNTDSNNDTYWNCRKEGQISSGQGRLENLLCQSGNNICADCGSPDPKWISVSLEVFICIKCSGVKRSLRAHISKVLSIKLDEWTNEQVDMLTGMGGNNEANMKYESCIPDYIRKPRLDSSTEERSNLITRKYETQQFFNSDEQMFCPFPPQGLCSPSSQGGSSSNQSGLPQEKKHNSFTSNRRRCSSGHFVTKSCFSWGQHAGEANRSGRYDSSKSCLLCMLDSRHLINLSVFKIFLRKIVDSDSFSKRGIFEAKITHLTNCLVDFQFESFFHLILNY
ncbi:hypothetical protein PVL29_026142 [Vitis rotundifolia]|uniref:Arf-GAP domain-containing protein n=1 Tax=Vitis rotundifolia TaxID=103349 RepID=A0AA38YLT1_VITRO|nr:hypothetical protein PVL29_026142 [Vitis rotundifolia]